MALLRNGIMGNVSGKVGGVVGARWKSKSYIRAYVVPGASETALQIAQRARFAYVVAAAKYYVGMIFNPYYDKFLSKMSGFNRFCSENIPKAPGYTPVTAFTVTNGPLFPGAAPAAVYTTGSGNITVSWATALGVDGLATDVAIAWGRSRLTNITAFSAPTTRSAGTVAITHFPGQTATDLDCGVFFAQMNGLLVSKISRNLSCQATAP